MVRSSRKLTRVGPRLAQTGLLVSREPAGYRETCVSHKPNQIRCPSERSSSISTAVPQGMVARHALSYGVSRMAPAETPP